MARVRISRSASVTFTAGAALLRTDLGSFALEGDDVREFVARLVPLLDGTRDAPAIADALVADFTPESVHRFLALLAGRGLVEPVPDDDPDAADAPFRGQVEFLAQWTDRPADAQRLLRDARVLVVGLEPWGVVAAAELAAAGVGTLHLLDDATVDADDRAAVRAWRAEHVGLSRRDALSRVLAESAPWCTVTASRPALAPGHPLPLPDGAWDLVLATAAADDLALLDALARATHARRLPTLHGHVDRLDAIVGPLVHPGETACWNCTRLRTLAHADQGQTAHALQDALLADRPVARRRTYLAPAAGHAGHLLALEAIKLLTGYAPSRLGGRLLVQHLVSLETTVHTIVRLPWCDVCGGAGDGPRPGAAGGPLDDARTPDALREALAGWVDARVGIVRQLVVNHPAGDDPELPITTTAVVAPYTDGHFHPTEPELGSGKGLTVVEAMIGAVGEAVERYSAARVRRGTLRRATPRALAAEGDVLDPARLAHYAEAQYAGPGFPFARVDPDQPIDWVPGRWLGTDAPVWVPAFPTYFNLHAPPRERFCQVSSNGLAAGASTGDAAVRAVLELVERDAFTLTWLAQLPARRLLPDDSLDVGAREALRQLTQCGAEVVLYQLDAGAGIPAVACVAFGDGTAWPGATVALSAHPDPRRAARKAILEQGHVGPYLRRLVRSGEHAIPAAPDDVRSLIDHALYYAPPERRRAFAFLDCDAPPPIALSALEPPRDTPDDAPDEAWLAERLAGDGLRVAVVDVTAPDVATGPFRVARALGEDTQPIHFGHALAQLANPRLVRRARRGLNPHPHPLA